MESKTKLALGLLCMFCAGEIYGRSSSYLKAKKKLYKMKTETIKTETTGNNVWAEELSKDITTWLRDPDDPRNSKEFVSEVISRFSDELRRRLKDSEAVIDVENESSEEVDQVQIKDGRVIFEGDA
jgi:hypothetical protein